jgi:hypothetical protein
MRALSAGSALSSVSPAQLRAVMPSRLTVGASVPAGVVPLLVPLVRPRGRALPHRLGARGRLPPSHCLVTPWVKH